jgi:hypothetical protein
MQKGILMGFELGNHHLSSAMQMKVIEMYVLTEEWQTAREMYDTFCKEVTTRTKLQPVLSGNYKKYLRTLVKDRKAESKGTNQFTRTGAPIRRPALLYRKPMEPVIPTCIRCGECCKWFVLGAAVDLDQETVSYIYARGGKIAQGYVVVPSRCPHLIEGDVCACDIHETKPQICANFNGKRVGENGLNYYVPDGCKAVRK